MQFSNLGKSRFGSVSDSDGVLELGVRRRDQKNRNDRSNVHFIDFFHRYTNALYWRIVKIRENNKAQKKLYRISLISFSILSVKQLCFEKIRKII